MAVLASATNLATRGHHLHQLKIRSQTDTNCIGFKFDHQVVLLLPKLSTMLSHLHCRSELFQKFIWFEVHVAVSVEFLIYGCWQQLMRSRLIFRRQERGEEIIRKFGIRWEKRLLDGSRGSRRRHSVEIGRDWNSNKGESGIKCGVCSQRIYAMFICSEYPDFWNKKCHISRQTALALLTMSSIISQGPF